MKQKQKGIENALYQVLNQKLGLRWLCPSAPPKTIFLEFSYPSTYPKKYGGLYLSVPPKLITTILRNG